MSSPSWSIADKIPPLQECEAGLLIGYDCPQALAPMKVILGKGDESFGVETNLGWSIVGLIRKQDDDEDEHLSHRIITKTVPAELQIGDRCEVSFMHTTQIQETPLVCLSQVIKTLEADFQDEQRDKNMSEEDIQFLRVLEENIHQNAEGFYDMPLPFKNGPPNNVSIAKKRLEQLNK